MLTIKNGRIITNDGILDKKNIIIEDGKIKRISDKVPQGSEVIDAQGNFVAPGFIDMHIHGASNCDTMDGTYDSINTISKTIAKHGVTSFVPTTTTYDIGAIKKSIGAVRECMKNKTDGAQVLGVHLEGPYINEKVKGAQNGEYILKPGIDSFLDMIGGDFNGIIRITLAPEIEGADELIKFLVGKGVIVSVGHSYGTYDQIMHGIGMGISHSTHLYNAMRGFAHREPGVVGAIFDSGITTEFICDGVHIHFAAIRTAIAVKGYQNCALITDAMQACCMEDGEFSLGGQKVIVKDGAARLDDGTLAGSTLTLDRAVRNILKNTDLGITEAISMASSVPAKIIKVDDRKGYIKPGYDADIIILDSKINILKTIVGGKVIQ